MQQCPEPEKEKRQVSSKKLLLVEDDSELASLLSMHLEELGYELDHVNDGERGLQTALEKDYSLVILDVMLPKMDGLEICRRLREKKKSVLILMLTSRSQEVDKVVGLELGADDYVTKPFKLSELIARIKALLRRKQAITEEARAEPESPERVFGDLQLNLETRKVFLRGKEIALTAREFDFLAFLSAKPGRAYSRGQILNHVWDCDFSGYEYSVNSLIKRLRKKIEDDPARPLYVRTVRGVGYRFAELSELSEPAALEEEEELV